MKGIFNYRKPAFWLLIIAAAVCIAALLGLLTSLKSDRQVAAITADLDDTQYKVAEVLYCDCRFSFIEDESNAPQYYITAGKLMWNSPVWDGADKNSWTEIGLLEQCDLNQAAFEGLFMDGIWQNAVLSDIYNRIVLVQKTEREFNGLKQIFYLFQLEDAAILLGRGFYHDDGTSFIRWLQKLEQVPVSSTGA